jgi:hypothetical protein
VHKSAGFNISCPLALACAKNEILNSVLCLIFGSFHQGKEREKENGKSTSALRASSAAEGQTPIHPR